MSAPLSSYISNPRTHLGKRCGVGGCPWQVVMMLGSLSTSDESNIFETIEKAKSEVCAPHRHADLARPIPQHTRMFLTV